MRYLGHILYLWLAVFTIVCCSSSFETTKEQKERQEGLLYTTAFPDRDVAEQLNEAQESILRIVSTGSYTNYIFEPGRITLPDIKTNNPADIASQYYTTDESTAGTAIILEHNKKNSLLITCEHIVSFQDTLITYYEGEEIPPNTYVESISIKQNQSNFIYTPHQFGRFDIIASDASSDLALLSASLSDEVKALQHPLSFSAGQIDNLQVGSFLYIFGFPKGYPMVTRGLASTDGKWNNRFFVTDASFNPGVSGGLIIASNDNFKSFQWIGIARSATASKENLLVPRPNEVYGKQVQPYNDTLFVQQKTRISYGITQAIPINRIKSFLADNKQVLSRHGFSYKAPFDGK